MTEPINFVLLGHVDHGKSTCAGRILMDTGTVQKQEVEKAIRDAELNNMRSWWLAYLLDVNDDERTKGKTVEYTLVPIQYNDYPMQLIDVPGHRQYVSEMISGTGRADIGVLICSAKKGEVESGLRGQTYEHLILARGLGIKTLVVGINKMDHETVSWSDDIFQNIKTKITKLISRLKFQNVKFLPISALDPKITPQVLSLAYAGTPGKKDLINNVIEAMLRLDPSGKRVHLTLAGSLEEEILNLPALRGREVSELPDCIEVLGHIPHEKALELIGRADFLPLLRANQRYAQAGFPTKVVESLALGTPVICNLTSDLGEYIHDGVEGIVCADYSTDAFAAALERALALTPQQRTEMRKAAREQAERSFDYRVYADSLLSFLNEMRQCI